MVKHRETSRDRNISFQKRYGARRKNKDSEKIKNSIKYFGFVINNNIEEEFFNKVKDYNVEIDRHPHMMSLHYPAKGTSIIFPCDEKTLASYKLFQLRKLVGEIEL